MLSLTGVSVYQNRSKIIVKLGKNCWQYSKSRRALPSLSLREKILVQDRSSICNLDFKFQKSGRPNCQVDTTTLGIWFWNSTSERNHTQECGRIIQKALKWKLPILFLGREEILDHKFYGSSSNGFIDIQARPMERWWIKRSPKRKFWHKNNSRI